MPSETYQPAPPAEGDYPPGINVKLTYGVPVLTLRDYTKDGEPNLIVEAVVGAITASYRGEGQYGPWSNLKIKPLAGEYAGQELTIWPSGKAGRECADYAWDRWGEGTVVRFERLPDVGRSHQYAIHRLTATEYETANPQPAPAAPVNPAQPRGGFVDATSLTRMYREGVDGGKDQGWRDRFIAKAAQAGYTFEPAWLGFVSVTADNIEDDLPF